MRRMARLGDGWLMLVPKPGDSRPKLDALDRFLAEAGRSRSSFGLEARMAYGDGNPGTWTSQLATPAAHIEAMRRIASALGLT
jgi:hypothetical protein